MNLLNKTAFVLTIALALGACKKKDQSPGLGNNYSPPVKDLIMAHSWIASDVLLNDTSIWSMMQDCKKDDIYTFKNNSIVTVDEGSTKCNVSDSQSTDQFWKSLGDYSNKMIFYSDTVEILQATPNLRFRRTDGADKYEIRMVAKP